MTSTAESTRTVEHPGWSFLRSRRWFGYYAIFIIFAVACTLFGNWQFDRRAEARAEIDRIDANYDQVPVPIGDVIGSLDEFDVDRHKWLPVTVTGEYIGDTYLVRGRPGPGGVGTLLINALSTPDGVLFVDRGWIPVTAGEVSSGEVNLDELPEPPRGQVNAEVRLRGSEPAIPGRVADGRTIGSIEAEGLAELTGFQGEAYTGVYGELIVESPAAERGEIPQRPERDEGPHLSYALQWYVFIVIAGFGLVYAARREFRTLNSDSEAVHAQDQRRAARNRRRGPSDADEEDAWIDA